MRLTRFLRTRVIYNSDSGEVQGEGHLLLEGGPNDEHIQASRGKYKLRIESGRFENVTGSIGLKVRKSRNIFTSSNPFFLPAKLWRRSVRTTTSSMTVP